MNPRYVALRVQFQLIAGKAVTSKSMRFNNGSAFLCVEWMGPSLAAPFYILLTKKKVLHSSFQG
ncbi:hypothetical protein OUZ56_011266 [Daphnia magna]|uniref:Uncharacterized protein n=1 Tax=Daphnia magna TaxID=35525 RepID=A0ABQ9YZP5_9CRUS|nr:hypothetical protein OUZ56_011266 [Daphnia magna]